MVGAALAASQAQAQATFSGGNANTNWSYFASGKYANWKGGQLPAAGTAFDLFVGAASTITSTLDLDNYVLRSINLVADSTLTGHAFSLAAGGTLTLGFGNSTIANDMAFQSSSFDAIGPTTTDTLGGTGSLTLSGKISGAGGFVKTNPGILNLNGANSYAGGVKLQAGTVKIGNATGLGTGTLYFMGGALDLNSLAVNVSNIQFGDGSNSWTDALGAVSNANTITLSGGVTYAGNTAKTAANWTAPLTLTAGQHTFGSTGARSSSAIDEVLGGQISGAGGIDKTGTYTLGLTSNSNYTGATNINAGAIYIGTTNALPTTTALTVASGATFSLNPTTAQTGITVGSSSQQIGSLAGAGSVLLGSAILTINGSSSTTFSGIIAGTGSLAMKGTGTLTLSGLNTFTGGISLSDSSTLKWGVSNAVPSTSALTLNNSSTLDLNGTTQTVASINESVGSPNVIFHGGSLTVGSGSGNETLQGPGSLTKNSSGTLNIGPILGLSSVTINAGTLNSATSSVDNLTVSTGAAMAAGSISVGTLSGAGTVTVGNLNILGDTNSTFNGTLTGGASPLTVTKNGLGTFTLTKAEPITVVRLSQGTLQLGTDNALGTPQIELNGGTLDVNGFTQNLNDTSLGGTTTITLGASAKPGNLSMAVPNNGRLTASVSGFGNMTLFSSSGFFTLAGTFDFSGLLTVSSAYFDHGITIPHSLAVQASKVIFLPQAYTIDQLNILQGNSCSIGRGSTLTTGSDQNSSIYALLDYAGNGVTTLIKQGTGTLTMRGASTFVGGTSVIGGLLDVPGSLADYNDLSIGASGAARFTGADLKVNTLNGGGSLQAGNLFVGQDSTLFSSNFSGPIVVYKLTKAGPRDLTLSGANSISLIEVAKGSLSLGAKDTIKNAGVTVSGGTLSLNGYDQTIQSLHGSGGVSLGNATLTVTNTLNTTTDYSGVISGAGSLTFGGNGTLSGANTYTGGTNVSLGTLTLGAANALPAASALTVTTATVKFGNFAQQVASLSGNNSGVVNMGSGAFTVGGSANATDSGSVSGTGIFTKIGTGNQSIASYSTGGTVVKAGTLTLPNGGSLGAVTLAGGALSLTGSSSNATDLNLGDGTAAAIGTLTSTNPLQITGSVTYQSSGSTAPATVSAPISLSTGQHTFGFNGKRSSGTYDAVFTAPISGPGGITKTGNTFALSLTGHSTYSGATNVNAGSLSLGIAQALPATTDLTVATNASLALNDNAQKVASLSGGGTISLGSATLEVSGSNSTNFTGAFSGTGSLMKSGSGTLTLSSAPASTGGALVTGGTLSVGGGNLQGAIAIDAAARLANTGSTLTFSGPVTSQGNIDTAANSSTVFSALVKGAGNFTGTGMVEFDGGFSPGNSSATVTIQGDVTLGSANDLTMELAGASSYDHLNVLGNANLAGDLNVVYYNGFTASLGQTFDLFDFAHATGTFSSITLPTLDHGLKWNTTSLYNTGEISVQAVPEPTSLAALGLGGLVLLRRRRK